VRDESDVCCTSCTCYDRANLIVALELELNALGPVFGRKSLPSEKRKF